MPQIILASQSPRRRELLSRMGVDFEVVPSDFEEYLDDVRTPAEIAEELGLGKAKAVAEKYPDAIVIGSDTIVSIDGKQLAKPADADEARRTLKDLSGRVNIVTTSSVVICKSKGIELVGSESAQVYFKPWDAAAVETYIASGDYMDKAGSYGIQSGAAPLVDRVEGDYSAIIGLPTILLADQLQQLGVDAKAVKLETPEL